MLNFPVPYPDELIYSTVARAGVHAGLTSPKMLLDEVFVNREVIATVDLPCHLESVSDLYPSSLHMNITDLIYKHTLFPLYAPFTSEERRTQCLKWMGTHSKGSVHLALGVAASRVKQIRYLRYCPECLKKQLANFGEFYWIRDWQVAGTNVCLAHGKLVTSSIKLYSHYRHQFFPLVPSNDDLPTPIGNVSEELRVAKFANELLGLPPMKSPSFHQWGAYYRNLADIAGCTKGKKINHHAIFEKVISKYSAKWLESNGLLLTNVASCWLKTLFRKHRKSFSYLEHMVAIDALLEGDWDFKSVLRNVLSLQREDNQILFVKNPKFIPTQERLETRNSWKIVLKKWGTKKARISGGAALYAWLYRNDRLWLLKINAQYRKHSYLDNQLEKITQKSQYDLTAPRRSKNWYLGQLGSKTSIVNNFDKLPLCTQFFEENCETISRYQIRRIDVVLNQLRSANEELRRWKILRLAGLSDERICTEAKLYLDQVK